MAASGRSRWPLVLLLGMCVSLLVGSAAAIAEPSESGRPWWREDEPVRVTGAVLSVDKAAHTITVDGLVSYDPVRAGIGTLTIDVAIMGESLDRVRGGDTVDVVIVRHDGAWIAQLVELLETD